MGKNTVMDMDWPMSDWVQTTAKVLAGIAIISSAFHFWPFEGSKSWEMFCPMNAAVLAWNLILVGYVTLKRVRWASTSLLPHISVLAYVSVNVLSMAFASDLRRTASFTIKLVLMLVGGYTLFSSAISTLESLRKVYGLMILAVMICVSYCLMARFGFNSDNFGFHNEAYKYGTYIGILVPLCGTYLLMSSKSVWYLTGVIVVIGALLSSGSLGAVAAIFMGMTASAIVTPGWSIKLRIVCCLVCGIGLIIFLGPNPATTFIRHDVRLAEQNGVDLKQRYIEWQAEVNLLEERTITGTAAGCINEYRSYFYYRLPKLNTLRAFDQNGWLTTGAETGILGLVCFCWIVVYYLELVYSQLSAVGECKTLAIRRFVIANFAGLTAVCAVNLFSSVHYNGILIVFVLVLALISRVKRLFEGQENEKIEVY